MSTHHYTSALARLKELQAMPYKQYLFTPEWRERRAAAVMAANGRCQLCNEDARTFHVHHRTYERRGCELPSDLTALCADCHGKYHNTDTVSAEQITAAKMGYLNALMSMIGSLLYEREDADEIIGLILKDANRSSWNDEDWAGDLASTLRDVPRGCYGIDRPALVGCEVKATDMPALAVVTTALIQEGK